MWAAGSVQRQGEHIGTVALDRLATPFAVVDLEVARRNISDMHRRLHSGGIGCRPHTKVHRLPDLARMQVEAGAVGIACHNLDEVEMMIAAGFGEIMLTNSLVDDLKLSRLLEVTSRAFVSITADSSEAVGKLSRLAEVLGGTASVYVECDIGGRRTGFSDPRAAAELAVAIARSSAIEFAGLAAYLGGNPRCSDIHAGTAVLEEVVSELDRVGLKVPSVSVGGTVLALRAWPDCRPPTITEARPGNYAFYDVTKVAYGLVGYEDCALRVVSTVVSTPSPTRFILDAGWRILSNNPVPGQPTYGHIPEYPHARTMLLYTEHAVVETPADSRRPRIGERVTIIPNSCDGVLASISSLHGIRGAEVEHTWRLGQHSIAEAVEPTPPEIA